MPPGGASAQTDRAPKLRTVEVAQDSLAQQFKSLIPLPQQLFAVGQSAPMDLFLPRMRHTDQGDFLETVCFLPSGQVLSQRQADALRQAGLDYYYAPRTQMSQVVAFMARQVTARLNDDSLPLSEKAHLVYEQASLIVEQAMGMEDLATNLEQGKDYIESLHGFVSQVPGAQQNLAQMLVLDYGLFTHSVNVCVLTTGFASHLKLPSKLVTELGLGALYHDLGKRGIPESILKKPGPLTEEEWEVIRRHPQEGFDLLAGERSFPQESRVVVHQHHENLDGSGYPLHLSRENLELGARLVRLVDAYDAITAVRVYKGAKHAFEAIQIIVEELKSQVDMDILRDFITFMGILAPQPGRFGRYGGGQANALASNRDRGISYTRSGHRK